jgi:hypothetical protein
MYRDVCSDDSLTRKHRILSFRFAAELLNLTPAGGHEDEVDGF